MTEPLVTGVTVQLNPEGDRLTFELEALHVTYWLLAFEGVIVAFNVAVSLIDKFKDVLSNVIPLIKVIASVTVNEHVAETLGFSEELQVIVQLPWVIGVITPSDTVAMPVGETLHVNLFWVVLEGIKLAVNVDVLFNGIDNSVWDNVIPVIFIGSLGLIGGLVASINATGLLI